MGMWCVCVCVCVCVCEQLMEDPVMLCDGSSYSRWSILRWLVSSVMAAFCAATSVAHSS